MSKTVIITGSTGNLGRAVTNTFASNGWQVIGTVEPGLDLPERTSDIRYAELDLRDHQSVADFVNGIADERIDACLMLAGGFAMGDVASTSKSDLDAMIGLNFETAYHMTRAVFDVMKKQGTGRLIYIGAKPAAESGIAAGVTAYALSKTMVMKLADIINSDVEKKGVTASVIVPSIIDTPPNRDAMPDADFNDWVKPEKIAESMLFLCSHAGADLRHSVLKLYGNS